MKDLKGTKTEKTCKRLSQVSHRHVTNTLTLRQKQEKTDMSRLPISLRKQPRMRKSMQNFGLSILKAVT